MTATAARHSRFHRMGWRNGHVVAAIALIACAVFVGWDAWSDIATIAAKDEESSHILLVPLVAAWLVWSRRERLRKMRPHGHWMGILIVLLGAVLYRIGDRYMVQSFWHGGAVIMALGGLVAAAGRDLVRFFLPAFIVCAFIVPIPGRIRQNFSIPLQSKTAWVTEHALELADMPVERSGNLLRVKGVDVSVAEACNGLRMMFALVLVSFTFAFTTPLQWYVRALILAATPVSAIACNVIRLVPTVWVYSSYSPTVAEKFHDLSGWLMLVIAFLLLMGIVHGLRWIGVPVTPFRLAAE